MVIKNQAVKFMRGNKPLSQACRPSLLLFTHGFQLVTVISLSVAIRCSPVPQHLLLPRTSLTKCLNKGIEGENRLLEFLSNTSFDIRSNLLFLPYSARIVENEFFKQDWRSPKKDEIYRYVVLNCTLALLIGLGIGLVGFFHNLAVEIIPGFKLMLTNNLMLENKYA